MERTRPDPEGANFGLSGPEGNHGEDAKEYWWYLDATPIASWLSWRYYYPQAEFPYARLREENARRTRDNAEFELLDTGIFDGDRYWQITADYAKALRASRPRAITRGSAPLDASRTTGLATRSSQDHWLRNAELRLQLAHDAPGKAMDLGDTLLNAR